MFIITTTFMFEVQVVDKKTCKCRGGGDGAQCKCHLDQIKALT
jgi:hypothetical protein